MMYRPRQMPTTTRPAVILMVVLAMLTLFAIVGISFVFYAQSQAVSSRFWRETDFERFRNGVPPTPPGGGGGGSGPGGYKRPGEDPGLMNAFVNWALGQLIYDAPDNSTGTGSGVRGHSLARTMYGFNDMVLNLQPFNGTGRLYQPNTALGLDNYYMVNYTYFQSDGFVRDPEHPTGVRVAGGGVTDPRLAGRAAFTGGHNPGYTYPDLNNMFLAATRADGTVLSPSFHRHWLFNPGRGLNDLSNPNWQKSNPQGKYLTLRPRPVDMGPGFPYPSDPYGDVKNKVDAPGGNDSIWIDMGHPVMIADDGTKYKPLFAWLVEDLDNRINLNVHGNLLGPNGAHASHQGWGKWEVNLSQVLNALRPTETAPAEWRNLFVGINTSPTTRIEGRYGPDGVPTATGNLSTKIFTPRFMGQIDFDAYDAANGTPTGPMLLPGQGANPGTSLFPLYPSGYANAWRYSTTSPIPNEQFQHPLLFDFFRPGGRRVVQLLPTPPYPANTKTVGYEFDDRVFSTYDLKSLLYAGYSGSEIASSTLTLLCPYNLGNDPKILNATQRAANARRRHMITTLSMDVDHPGLGPWLFDRNTASNYTVPAASPDQPPFGPEIPFPPLSARVGNVPAYSDFNLPGQPVTNPASDWRSFDAKMDHLDVNRPLPAYPHLEKDTNGNLVRPYYTRFDDSGPLAQKFVTAQQARQDLARDLYLRLLILTGVSRPVNSATPTDAELAPRRWLAQLAVNMVDYIDEDEISTPFNFYHAEFLQLSPPVPLPDPGDSTTNPKTNEKLPKYWVFGVELPNVVLNEVMTEYKLPLDKNNQPTDGSFDVKVWAELFCTSPTTVSNPNIQQQDMQPVPLYVPAAGGNAAYTPYRVVVANSNTSTTPKGPLYPRWDNVLGAPDEVRVQTAINGNQDFNTPSVRTVGTNNPTATQMQIRPQGYFLVGPTGTDGHDTIKPPRVDGTTPWLQSPNMQYSVDYKTMPAPTWSIDDRPAGVTVLLRRLANPHLPPDDRATVLNGSGAPVPNPTYNPYITTDYMERLPLNENVDANDKYASRGKKQPYGAFISLPYNAANSQVVDQVVNGENIQHTLGARNNPTPPSGKYDWLCHLDRQLVSPMELLQVAGCRPCELTHRFIDQSGTAQGHRAPWFDEDLVTGPGFPTTSHRLWRLFEMLETADRATGVDRYGRIPGKININTIWDPEVLLALCDPQMSNAFTSVQIYNPAYVPGSNGGALHDPTTLWGQLVASRTPGMMSQNNAFVLSGNDRPFLGFGIGQRPGGNQDPQAPNGMSINNTLLRSVQAAGNGSTPRLFQVPPTAPHPYLQDELLTKVFNNLTTRSNVFAVWLTVGFFKVTDDTTLPPKLGEEVGASTGQTIRHRYFAIVDRTQLMVSPALTRSYVSPPPPVGTPPLPLPPVGQPVVPPPSPGAVTQLNTPVQVRVQPTMFDVKGNPISWLQGTLRYQAVASDVPATGPVRDIPWQIQKGSIIVVDQGENQETVVVTNVPAPDTFEATFKKYHYEGFRITMYGNPGPQPGFDWYYAYYYNRDVVQYFANID